MAKKLNGKKPTRASYNKKKEPKVEYVIKDKHFGDLKILHTANAWWIDRGKVDALISAFKIDAQVKEAIVYAGITLDQYKYFCEKHPDFYTIKQAIKQLPVLKARKRIVQGLDESYGNAMDYLKRKRRKEFGDSHDLTSDGKPLQIVFDNAFASETERNSAESSKI